jgi:hypothetical protein
LPVEFVVQGEDDKHEVTAGSLVTLKVTLSRSPLLDPNRPVTLPVVVDDEPDDDDDEVSAVGYFCYYWHRLLLFVRWVF